MTLLQSSLAHFFLQMKTSNWARFSLLLVALSLYQSFSEKSSHAYIWLIPAIGLSVRLLIPIDRNYLDSSKLEISENDLRHFEPSCNTTYWRVDLGKVVRFSCSGDYRLVHTIDGDSYSIPFSLLTDAEWQAISQRVLSDGAKPNE